MRRTIAPSRQRSKPQRVLEFDDAGVQTLCRLRDPDCLDSCDTGFHLARWGHGTFAGDATTDELCPP